ncbi:helix-turn-helix domain-containing protein [archaeon]|nr:helix-turn-helix domain-containing protein [archaeon]
MSNLINKAYKFRFYPPNDLKEILAKTFGCSRFVYNQTLAFSEAHTYHDRDENACINLYNYKNTVGTTVNASGGNYFTSNDLSRIVRPKTKMKINSTKSRAKSSEAGIPCL